MFIFKFDLYVLIVIMLKLYLGKLVSFYYRFKKKRKGYDDQRNIDSQRNQLDCLRSKFGFKVRGWQKFLSKVILVNYFKIVNFFVLDDFLGVYLKNGMY